MIIRAFSVVVFSLAVLGCAGIDPVSITGPNGKVAYSMRCSGFGRTRLDCLKKAEELCPGGYEIVDDLNRLVGSIDNGTGVVATRNDLTISCR